MDELIPLYCNNCNLPITKGVKYWKSDEGMILCTECFENIVLKPQERENKKTSIRILKTIIRLYKWLKFNLSYIEYYIHIFRKWLLETNSSCPICNAELDCYGRCTLCSYGWDKEYLENL